MFNSISKIPHWKRVVPKDLDELYERVNRLSRISGIGKTQVFTGPTGVQVKGVSSGVSIGVRIFEVQTTDAGDGVYNCYEQILDGSDWGGTGDSTDKVIDKNTDTVEVLNLLENYFVLGTGTTGFEHLGLKDRLAGWEVTDDDGDKRLVGIPLMGSRIRLAKTAEAAPAATALTCNLLDFSGTEIAAGLGSAIEVNCIIAGGGNLNAAVPRLTDDLNIPVFNIGGLWYCSTIFSASEDCDCFEEP